MAHNDNLIPRPLAWEWAKPRVDTVRYPTRPSEEFVDEPIRVFRDDD